MLVFLVRGNSAFATFLDEYRFGENFRKSKTFERGLEKKIYKENQEEERRAECKGRQSVKKY